MTSEPSCSACAAALRLLVAIELALDAVDLAVEQVDERPQKIGEIVLEAGAGQHRAEGLDRGVELAADGYRARARVADRARPGRGDSRRARVRRADARSAMRRGIPVVVEVAEQREGAVGTGHGGCLSVEGWPRPRGLHGDPDRIKAAARRRASGAGAKRRMAGGQLFCFALHKPRALPGGGKLGGPRILEAGRLRRSPLGEGRRAAISRRTGSRRWPPAAAVLPSGRPRRTATSSVTAQIDGISENASAVGRDELIRQTARACAGAETAEIEVEVGVDRHEVADIDAGGCPFAQPLRRIETGCVVVAGDIEAAQ